MSEDSSLVVTLEDLKARQPLKVNPHISELLGLDNKHTYKIMQWTWGEAGWPGSIMHVDKVLDITDGCLLTVDFTLYIDNVAYEDLPIHIAYKGDFPAFYLVSPRRELVEELPTDRWLFIAQESE